MKLISCRELPLVALGHRHSLLLIGGLSLLLMGASRPGSSTPPSMTKVTQAASQPIRQAKLQLAGNLSMGITNYGMIPWISPPNDIRDRGAIYPGISEGSPYFEFPAGSGSRYLYNGGLWVGGIVGSDTLVSLTVDATSATQDDLAGFDSIRESSNIEDSPFYHLDARSQQQFDCRYFDTLILSSRDETANRPHKPLGLEISQTSHAWLSAPYDHFIIVEYTIRNISTSVIESTYVGFFVDSDVWNQRFGRGGAEDDVSGYLRDLGIVYAMDNDGDPSPDTTWDSASNRGALGLVPLRIEPAPSCTSFNWWTLGNGDWGPANGHGIVMPPIAPIGDASRFARMANGRISSDQMMAAVDPTYNPGEVPSARLVGIAYGTDTRFLLSFGSFHLPPGDSITVAMAFVAGDSVHQSPHDFSSYFNALNPQPHYDRLYFGDLIRSAGAARRIYSNGFRPVGGAPVRITAEPLSDTSVILGWSPAPFEPVSGYRVYRRLRGSDSNWELLSETGSDWRAAADLNARRMATYEYAVAAVDPAGLEGSMSRPAVLTAGWPLVVPSLSAAGDGARVNLTWAAPVQPPGFSPLEFLNIYRRGLWDTLVLRARIPLLSEVPKSSSQLEKAEAASASPPPRLLPPPLRDEIQGKFIDSEVASGRKYVYSASVANTLGQEGTKSRLDTVLPMALDRGTLVVFSIYSHLTAPGFLNSDSMLSFYSNWAARSGLDPEFFNTGQPTELFPTLEDLSHYRNILTVSEEAGSAGGVSRLAGGLKEYITNGGRCLLAGRYIPSKLSGAMWSPTLGSMPIRTFPDTSFAIEVLGVRRERIEVTWPDGDVCLPSVQFRGATSLRTGYPSLDGDSARALDNPMFEMIDNRNCFILGGGRVPAVGVIDSVVDAEVLYTYQAGFPDTSSYQGRSVAIRRDVGKGRIILLNFPLSLMERPAAWDALDAAMADLGASTAPSGGRIDETTARQLLEYLYGKSRRSADPSWDLSKDGLIDIYDLMEMLAGNRRE